MCSHTESNEARYEMQAIVGIMRWLFSSLFLSDGYSRSAESLLSDLLTEDSWRELMDQESKKPYFAQLEAFLKKEMDSKTVYPPTQQILRALNELPVSKVKAVIIGQVLILCGTFQSQSFTFNDHVQSSRDNVSMQDPYHGAGQAEGLCFSVPKGQKVHSLL